MLMGVASGAFVIIWSFSSPVRGSATATWRQCCARRCRKKSSRNDRRGFQEQTDRRKGRVSGAPAAAFRERGRSACTRGRTVFEQEERDAGGTEGFDIEDDYEEEALADNEEEGDTG